MHQAVAALLVLAAVRCVHAQEHVFVNSTVVDAALSGLGYAVAATGNTLLVGAPDFNHVSAGAVDEFSCVNAASCVVIASSVTSFLSTTTTFGAALAVAGPVLVVGDGVATFVYLLQSNGNWKLQTLGNPTSFPAANAQAVGVSAYGSTGSSWFVVTATSVGQFHTATCNTTSCSSWSSAQNFTAAVNSFGMWTAVAGTLVVVGVPELTFAGSAYVFNCSALSSCSVPARLQSTGSGNQPDYFGVSAALSFVSAGTVLLAIGASGFDSTQGAVFVWWCSTTTCPAASSQTLVGSQSATNAQFGFSVAVSGNVIYATTYQNDASLYMFDCSNLVACALVSVLTSAAGNEFGYSLAVNENSTLAVVGAPSYGSNSGAAVVFGCANPSFVLPYCGHTPTPTATHTATATKTATSTASATATPTATTTPTSTAPAPSIIVPTATATSTATSTFTSTATATATATASTTPTVQLLSFFYSNAGATALTGVSMSLQLYDVNGSGLRRSAAPVATYVMASCAPGPFYHVNVPNSHLSAPGIAIAITSSDGSYVDAAVCNSTVNPYLIDYYSPVFVLASTGCGEGARVPAPSAPDVVCGPTSRSTTTPSPSPTPTTSVPGGGANVGAIVGGILGALAALILALLLLLLLYRRRKHRRGKDGIEMAASAGDIAAADRALSPGYSNAMLVGMTSAKPSAGSSVSASIVGKLTGRDRTATVKSTTSSTALVQELTQRGYITWTNDEVCAWAASIGVTKPSVKALNKNNVNGAVLEDFVNEDEIAKFGITVVGDRRILSKTVQQLQQQRTASLSRQNSEGALDNVFIERSKIELGDVLASGQFGKVFVGKFKGAVVAIKQPSNADDNAREDFLEEARLMKSIPPHPNVVQYYGVCVLPNELFVVIEHCDLGSLQAYVRKNPRLASEVITSIAAQIAAGMSHLSGFIVHRDLAARNILLVSATNSRAPILARVADFGLSRPLNQGGYMRVGNRHPIPVPWTPSEVLNGDLHTPASDVWSFGVVLWEIYMGCPEAPPKPNRQAHPPLPQPDGCPDAMFAVMSQCWAQAPTDRPSFEQLFSDLSSLQ